VKHLKPRLQALPTNIRLDLKGLTLLVMKKVYSNGSRLAVRDKGTENEEISSRENAQNDPKEVI